MELVGVIAGVAGALVVLGAWLTGRNERQQRREADRREDRRARIEAAVAFLAAYRRFRRFVLTDDPEVVDRARAAERDFADAVRREAG